MKRGAIEPLIGRSLAPTVNSPCQPPTTTRTMLRPRYGRDAFRMSCSALNERALHSFPGQVVSVSRLAPRRSASWLANLGGMARAAGSARPGGSAAPSSSDPNIPSNLPPGTRVYTQTKTLPFSQSQLFTLVADVNRYHEFLPFCTMSRVVGPADGESTPLPREDLTSQTLTSASSIEESSFSPPASPPPASMSTMRGPAARSSTKTQSLDPISTLISFFQPRIAPALDTSTSDTSSLSSLPPSTLPESPRPPATPAVQGKESQATYRAVLADLGIGYGAFQEEYRSKVELTGQEIVRVRLSSTQ